MAHSSSSSPPRNTLSTLLQKAAAIEISKADPWDKYHIDQIAAERIIRHTYDPVSQQWLADETIVKIQKEPFTHGAMRFCYRMKKRSPPPQSASNSRFHRFGWSRASNYGTQEEQSTVIQDKKNLSYLLTTYCLYPLAFTSRQGVPQGRRH
jgi:elongation factor 2 kinase